MADGLLEKGPIYSDITKFVPSAELSKVILGMIGGFPCQVHHVNQLELGVFFSSVFLLFHLLFQGSSRSGKRLGLSDPRTGLIREMFRLIDVCPGMSFSCIFSWKHFS